MNLKYYITPALTKYQTINKNRDDGRKGISRLSPLAPFQLAFRGIRLANIRPRTQNHRPGTSSTSPETSASPETSPNPGTVPTPGIPRKPGTAAPPKPIPATAGSALTSQRSARPRPPPPPPPQTRTTPPRPHSETPQAERCNRPTRPDPRFYRPPEDQWVGL